MNQTGRCPKFKVNRKLTSAEYKYQLKPYHLNPWNSSYLSKDEFITTIKMNSSYLELVDRCFYWRGFLALVGLILLGAGILWSTLFITSTRPTITSVDFLAWLFLTVVPLCTFSGVAYWWLKDELFNLTHNPIRFDRRNRMVYAFLYNREVVAAPWEDIFFCVGESQSVIGRGPYVIRDIRGHILADDGVTVKATFALGHREIYYMLKDDYNDRELYEYWNFINRYMEKGPEELMSMVKIYHPIADQKESLMWGFHVFYSNLSLCGFLIFPLMVVGWACRLLAITTGKRPIWPDWVEEKCKIEPDDPYARDARFNPPIKIFTDLKLMDLHYKKQRFQSAPSDQNPLDEVPYRDDRLFIGAVLGSILGTILTVAFIWWIF